ncbi:MAG: ComF family protein [Anaerolineales bacterium]
MKRSITRPGKRWLERALEAGLDFLFPPRCAGCGRHGYVWCPECDSKLILTGRSGCPHCGFPRITRQYCPACELGNVQVLSYARYQPPLKQAILRLKYSPNRQLAAHMAGWMLELYANSSFTGDMILPVPLGRVRKRERGYNQVELIASSMARDLNIPVQAQSLVRVHETRSQVGLDPEERFENVHEAFSADSKSVQNQNILLLDDLLTSGATLLGCTQALFAAGASRVLCLTVGRTNS